MNRMFKRTLISAILASGMFGAGVCVAADAATPAPEASTMQQPATGASSMPSGTSTAPDASTSQSTGSSTSGATPAATPGTSTGTSTGATTSGSAGAAAPSSPTAAQTDAAKRIFDQLDTNHDGVLSLEEFSRATFQSR